MYSTTFALAAATAAVLFSSIGLAANTIAFTQVPANVTAGVPTVIKWAGGDPTGPVTITLKEGDPHSLKSVAILTGDATGGSFTWTPSSSLPNAQDYALQITQDVNTINYSGLFPLTGGTDSSSATTGSMTGTDLATATVLVANSTTATTDLTTLPPSASGTGLSSPRNTTFVSQTLTPTGSVGLTAGSATSTKASATGSGASASASATGAAGSLGGSLMGVAAAGMIALACM